MTGPLTLSGNATQPLHAVPLQQINSAAAGGPFLPTSGGTVSGNLTLNNAAFQHNWAQNATTQGGYFFGFSKISGSLSGVASSGADYALSLLQTTSDTLDIGQGGLVGHYITMHSGGTGTSGNRVGVYIDVHHAGSTLDHSRGWYGGYAALWAYAYGDGPMGGTPGNGYGQMWGGVISGRLTTGAMNWLYCVGLEVDVGVDTGASASIVQGQKIVVQFHKQTSNPNDYYLSLIKQDSATPGLTNGIVFGSLDGEWPVTATGTMIGTQAGTLGQTHTPPAAAWGVDFSAVAFSGGLMRGPGGFSIDGTGKLASVNTAGGLHCGSVAAGSATDLSKHLDLYGGQFGFSVTPGSLNLVVPSGGEYVLYVGTTLIGLLGSTGLTLETGGLSLPIQTASGVTDYSKQINLYNGQAGISITSNTNLNYVGFGAHIFFAGSVELGGFTSTGIWSDNALTVGGFNGPTWTTGSTAPSSVQPVGSLYSRVSTWAAGATLYVSKGAGAWTAVAGV